MHLELGKMYHLQNNGTMRVICVDRKGASGLPCVGLVTEHDMVTGESRGEYLCEYSAEGKTLHYAQYDVDFIPAKA